MCGRIDLRANPFEIAACFRLSAYPTWPTLRYNLSPGQQILAVRQHTDGTRTADPMYWGFLPPWATSINEGYSIARSETVGESKSFSRAIRTRRCVIPTTGFYEWQQAPGNTPKQPWHIRGNEILFLPIAGIWQTWREPGGDTYDTCAILTTAANRTVGLIKDRMPVILSHTMAHAWINPSCTDAEPLREFYLPCPEEWLVSEKVSTLVNNARHDSPECIAPLIPDRCEYHGCRSKPACKGLVFGGVTYVCAGHSAQKDFTLIERLPKAAE